MSDKEILVQSIDSYAKKLASDLFHLNSVASQSLITYVIRNLEDKYGMWLDLFVDKSGNINIDLLGNAVIEEIKNRSKKALAVVKADLYSVEYSELRPRWREAKSP